MALDPLARLLEYQAALTAAGIRCVLDGRDANPPCVHLRPPTMSWRFGRGCIEASFEARLYLPDSGQLQSITLALPMLQQIQDALAGAIIQATPGDYALADGSTVPGYSLTWTTH